MKPWADENVGVALWGVGNHGGGPSRKDLADIQQFQAEMKAQGVDILHSTPEALIEAIQPTEDFPHALQLVLVKCYASDSRIKQKHAELENKLLITEKICVIAQKELGVPYPMEAIAEAQKCMAAIQFHDILSGTSIRVGEESSLQRADYAMEILDKAFTKAFMALMNEYEKVTPDTYPLFAFNPHPYVYDGVVEGEFLMLDPIGEADKGYEFVVTQDGRPVEFQIVKEDSNINFDRRKRLAIYAKLPPMSVAKFDISYIKGKRFVLDREPQFDFDFGDMQAKFDRENGSLVSYTVNGREYLKANSFMPVVFDDNEDPWGWDMVTVGTNYRFMTPKIIGRVVERGPLYTKLENVYESEKSEVCVWYKIYKDFSYIDVDVRVTWNDNGKGLKLAIPFANNGKFIGQTAFGTQTYETDKEQCAQRFCGIDDGEKVSAVYANYIGGCSIENGVTYVTLFNGSVYCAHPLGKLPIVDNLRCNDYLEKGRHSFKFRLSVDNRDELERNAIDFVQKPYVLNAYPHGKGKTERESFVALSNESIVLESLRMVDNSVYALRLFNNNDVGAECTCRVGDKRISLRFGAYEVKTLFFDGNELVEKEYMLYNC